MGLEQVDAASGREQLPHPLSEWTPKEAARIGREPVLGRHHLPELDLFSDDGLIALLDHHPHERLEAWTMDPDPERVDEFRPVLLGGATGDELFAAVGKGRLWLNVIGVAESEPLYGTILGQLYEELRGLRPDFRPEISGVTLVIGSPTAIVSYHADAAPNLLWHIRGSKLLRVYPFTDRFIDRDRMEDIFAAVAPEELPFRFEFDNEAEVFHLEPGDVLSWPQNRPHRIENMGDLNVSLSTEYETPESLRRRLTWVANRFFRRKVHLPATSVCEEGAWPAAKRFTYRVSRKLGLDPPVVANPFVARERIDPGSPLGITALEEPIPTEFGYH